MVRMVGVDEGIRGGVERELHGAHERLAERDAAGARGYLRIEGQVRGLQDMVADGAYCIDVIAQTSAAKRALSGVEDALMEGHLKSCVDSQIKKGQEGKATAEILKVYGLKRR